MHLTRLLIVLVVGTFPLRAAGELVVKSDGRWITVRLTADQAVWVGCTLFEETGQQVDLAAKYVRTLRTVSFQIPRRLQASGANYVCATWSRRIEHCGCEYCARNGYHLEERQDAFHGRVPTADVVNLIRRVEADIKRMIRDHPEEVEKLLWFFGEDEGARVLQLPHAFPLCSPQAAVSGDPCDCVTLPVECGPNEYVRVPTLVVGDICVFGDCEGFARSKNLY